MRVHNLFLSYLIYYSLFSLYCKITTPGSNIQIIDYFSESFQLKFSIIISITTILYD